MPQKASPKITLYFTPVNAGFPSPAEDFSEDKLDLNQFLIKHPASTYFVRVKGQSMKDIGISDGDLLIVDRSLEVYDKKIVIASIDGEFTVKEIQKIKGELFLVPHNSEFKPIKINSEDSFQIFGVVTHVIKKL